MEGGHGTVLLQGGDAARPLIAQSRAKFAICNAGGGFAYVGAMHDSFPHALEISKKRYNAFAVNSAS